MHLAVGEHARVPPEALLLDGAGPSHARPYRRCDDSPRLSSARAWKDTAPDLDLEVHPVHEGPETRLRYRSTWPRVAQASVGAVAVVPARTRVHGPHQEEAGGKALGAPDPGHQHRPVLQRLAQSLQGVAPELGELVQEEHAVVGQADLTGAQRDPAAHQPRVAHRVVGCPEGTAREQRPPRRKAAGHRVDPRRLEGLGEASGAAGSPEAAGPAWSSPPRAAP